MYLGRLSRFTRMTDITAFDRPGHFAVMTGPAILAIDNLQHVDLITTSLHFEPEIGVAYLAPEADPVEPVRKHNRSHPGCIGIIIDENVTIFCVHCDWWREK